MPARRLLAHARYDVSTRLLALAAVFTAFGCGQDEDYGRVADGSGGSGGAPTEASFSVRGTVEQVYVTHAEPGTTIEVADDSGQVVASGKADSLGSLVLRGITPGGGYAVREQSEPTNVTAPVTILGFGTSKPDQSFYAQQQLTAGVNYLTMRDGTTLAAYITLPGPPEKGPYPTIVNYSGYSPAKPGAKLGDYEAFCGSLPVLCDAPDDASALIGALMGYATVGVNMRGTGCSGGAYDFFEPLQLLDGYDVIEIVAAQDWVLHNKVGMTGLSYPGISQLFVAKMQPPSLAAITPLSVIGSAHTTLVPGGILNDGFAIQWVTNVLSKAAPYAQGWEQARVDGGDTICEENQLLHDQRVDVIQKARDNPYYSAEVADPVNPSLFASEIEVPVFLACSWQDEQTGPYCFNLLNRFDNAPVKRFTVYNGVHPDGFAPQVLAEWKAFLDIYVKRAKPSMEATLTTLAPLLFKEVFKTELSFPEDRFADVPNYEAAKALFEAEPSLRVIFENGAGGEPGAPAGTFEKSWASWPPPSASARRFYFQPDGSLADDPPTVATAASVFELDPEAGQRGILAPGGQIWDPLPDYAWAQPAAGKAAVFEGAPLAQDLVMVGSGSVDLFLRSNVDDADLEVNLSEVRPDGQEVFVQSGWLRASRRKLAASSTELWPEHTQTLEDEALLVPGDWVAVRVGLTAASHVFRAGSRIRIAIDTPGDSRAEWFFDLKKFSTVARHSIAHDVARPSSVALSVVSDVTVTTPLPPCPSLRAQQCRPHVAYVNTPEP